MGRVTPPGMMTTPADGVLAQISDGACSLSLLGFIASAALRGHVQNLNLPSATSDRNGAEQTVRLYDDPRARTGVEHFEHGVGINGHDVVVGGPRSALVISPSYFETVARTVVVPTITPFASSDQVMPSTRVPNAPTLIRVGSPG